MIREAKGFIFDMDGTLLSLPMDWPRIRSRLAEKSGRDQFQPVFETMREVITERPELRTELFRTLEEYELEAEPSALIHQSSREVVELLSRRSKLALVTMQGEKVRDSLLRRFALAPYFRALLSREDSLDRAEQLDLALRAISIPKTQAVFVGDRLNDLNAAARVGVDFVFIRSREDTAAEVSFRDMASFMAFLSRQEA